MNCSSVRDFVLFHFFFLCKNIFWMISSWLRAMYIGENSSIVELPVNICYYLGIITVRK